MITSLRLILCLLASALVAAESRAEESHLWYYTPDFKTFADNKFGRRLEARGKKECLERMFELRKGVFKSLSSEEVRRLWFAPPDVGALYLVVEEKGKALLAFETGNGALVSSKQLLNLMMSDTSIRSDDSASLLHAPYGICGEHLAVVFNPQDRQVPVLFKRCPRAIDIENIRTTDAIEMAPYRAKPDYFEIIAEPNQRIDTNRTEVAAVFEHEKAKTMVCLFANGWVCAASLKGGEWRRVLLWADEDVWWREFIRHNCKVDNDGFTEIRSSIFSVLPALDYIIAQDPPKQVKRHYLESVESSSSAWRKLVNESTCVKWYEVDRYSKIGNNRSNCEKVRQFLEFIGFPKECVQGLTH